MLSVAIHKDIGEYEPKIIGKLTFRSLVCIAAALVVSLLAAAYCTWVLALNSIVVMYVSFILSVPFWAVGFIKPKGLKFEVFARYWIDFNTNNKKIFYVPTAIKAGLLEDPQKGGEKKYDKQYRKFIKQPGIESYSPKAGRVIK